jgi:hypothetical protein
MLAFIRILGGFAWHTAESELERPVVMETTFDLEVCAQ